MGTQNCGKYLCSQTWRAFVVSNSHTPSNNARTLRGVDSTLWGPDETKVVAKVSRLLRSQSLYWISKSMKVLTLPFLVRVLFEKSFSGDADSISNEYFSCCSTACELIFKQEDW